MTARENPDHSDDVTAEEAVSDFSMPGDADLVDPDDEQAGAHRES